MPLGPLKILFVFGTLPAVMVPLAVVRLEPLASVRSLAVVSAIVPVPLVARSLVVFGRLIVPLALTVRLLFAPRVTAPVKETALNSPPTLPTLRLALKSRMVAGRSRRETGWASTFPAGVRE